MKARSLEEIACLLAAPIKGGDGRTPVRGAGIDSRALRRGDLFFALQGSRTHGIRFAGAALAAGAPAVVVELQLAAEVPGRAIPVADPARALGLLAAQVRREEAGHLPAAAITGSVGKTTTCGYAATLLAGVRQVHGPRGSHNNALGVPLTILNAPEECDALICEVGSNHPGEIAPLARWIRPEIACVTAVAPAHLDGFGSIAAIEEEKLSLLSALPAGGEAWIPVSLGARGSSLLADCRGRVRSFGPQGDLEVKGGGGRWVLSLRRAGWELPFHWDPPYGHSIRNLEAALAVAMGLGACPEELLAQVPLLELPPLRGEVRRHGGVDLLLDCYNSSPEALEAAIDRLEREPAAGRRLCVIGTMEELGAEEKRWHQRLGGRLAAAAVDVVFLVGRGAAWLREAIARAGGRGEILRNDEPSARRLAGVLRPGDRVLFKASRAEALERLAERVALLLDGGGGSP